MKLYSHRILSLTYFVVFCLEPDAMMIKAKVPGPGTYAPVIEINKLGKYILSTSP